MTLKGRVDSHEEVARAIRMAVEEDDVLEVTSTLQVSASGAAAERLSGVEAAPQPIRRAQSTATPLPRAGGAATWASADRLRPAS